MEGKYVIWARETELEKVAAAVTTAIDQNPAFYNNTNLSEPIRILPLSENIRDDVSAVTEQEKDYFADFVSTVTARTKPNSSYVVSIPQNFPPLGEVDAWKKRRRDNSPTNSVATQQSEISRLTTDLSKAEEALSVANTRISTLKTELATVKEQGIQNTQKQVD